MNSDYVARALCFHGPPMQKIWLDERGDSDLQKMGLLQPNFTIYQERQRYFTFQDRAKRLKLHQFITRKAADLYPNELRPRGTSIRDEHIENAKKHVAIIPPYEVFYKTQDKAKRRQIALAELKEGDIIYGDVKDKSMRQLNIRPLCTAEPLVRFMADLNIKAMVNFPHFPTATSTAAAGSSKALPYNTNDYVCCEVQSVSLDAGRINLTMIAGPNSNPNVQLGVVQYEELPAYYRQVTERPGSYTECLLQAPGFENPNYDDLFTINGLNVHDTYSLIGSLKFEFPRDEYAKELRQTQAGKWAIRSVAEGIERFKQGQHLEAFQYLNKALNIDPHNVEGLVARGALYANKGSFLKAVADFEKALKLNVYHGNARKYLGETLVALGRSYEEEQRLEDAAKAYKDCLNIMPKHDQALFCLNAVNVRLCNAGLQPYHETRLPMPLPPAPPHMQQMMPGQVPPNMQPQVMETSAVSVSSSDEDDSSGDDSSSDTSAKQRQKSQLSPMSLGFAMQGQMCDLEPPPPPEYNRPFFATENSSSAHRFPQDFRLDEDDTDKRVRRLLEAASKHKKDKKKKKKAKKSKKSSSKDSAIELLKNIDFKEAFKAIGGIQFEHKITENLQLYGQTINEIKKRQEQQLQRDGSETPPPPPSMTLPTDDQPSTSRAAPPLGYKNSTISFGVSSAGHSMMQLAKKPPPAPPSQPQQKLSFQIKRPVKMDKFGLIRIATPLTSPRRSRSRSNSPKRNNNSGRRTSRSRSRSIDRGRGRGFRRSRDRVSRGRRSRSRSRSRRRRRSRSRSRRSSRSRRRGSRSRSKSNDRRGRRRRSPSTPARRRRHSSSESPSGRRGATRGRGYIAGRPPGQRTWCPPSFRATAGRTNSRWQHDKFRVDSSDDDDKKSGDGGDSKTASKIDDGPSIEEIDEIIKEAQNKRKQSIINNNKDILKKPFK